MQILHFNFKKNVQKICASVYIKFERNYQTFNKIRASYSFGRHIGGQSRAFQHGSQYKSYCFVETIKLP